MTQRIPALFAVASPSTLFPFLEWLPGYDTRRLKSDLGAGLTVELVLIPQSMAYAQLAGLPSYYGLYAAFLPPAIAALFGSSRQRVTGPVAVALTTLLSWAIGFDQTTVVPIKALEDTHTRTLVLQYNAALAEIHQMADDRAALNAVSYGLKECRYIDAVRFDGPLFFANASYFEDQIRHRRQIKKQLKHIIIGAEGISDIDASGQETYALIVERVRSAGIDISLSGVHEAVMQVLKRTHLFNRIGTDHFYPSMKNAIRAIHGQTHTGGSEKNCPLNTVRTLDSSPSGKGK